jgi:hypothetical protein
MLEIAPLAFMRGRTLNNAFVILDEAQNTTPEQMKMFLTRIGFGAKAVVTGDVSQIDLPKGAPSGWSMPSACSNASRASPSTTSPAPTWCATRWWPASWTPTTHAAACPKALRRPSTAAAPGLPALPRQTNFNQNQ